MIDPYYIENLIQKFIDKKKNEFKGTEEEFQNRINEKLPEMITSISEGIIEEFYKYCMDDKNDSKKRERKIVQKIDETYALGLKLFDAFIELNTKIGYTTYNKFYKIFSAIEDQSKLETLIANHVRACQIANEIRVLVANGYADGAHARWRTLHEICIIFLFLYDSDYDTIEMYNDYQVIESWQKANEYKQSYEELGFDPIDENEWKSLDQERRNLIDKYGKGYERSYGWTMKRILNKDNRTIKGLEKLVGKEYLRPVYAWASENVHAGVSGIRQRISLRENEQHNFLTGPNDCGFLDPIQYTSYSLTEMSSVLLAMEESLLNKIMEELLYFFQNELVNEFKRIEE